MTGPEHYAEAERLLKHANTGSVYEAKQAVAHAQVHATLALAAATALQLEDNTPHRWSGVLS